MNILIIGTNGFIGSAATHYFLKLGYEVSGCDIAYYPNNPIAPADFTVLNQSQPDFGVVFRGKKFDCCLNASGAAHVGFSMVNPLEDFRLNVYNVVAMLEAVRQYNSQCKFINLSSAAVYGNPQYLPIDEKHPQHPISPYGWHKLQSEHICHEFHDLFNLKTCSLRIFSAYGPGLKKQLFWDLYQKVRRSNSVALFGTGKESRDFIYIDDLLQAIQIVFEKCEFRSNVLNVANGEEITIKEAAALFTREWNPDVKVKFGGETKPGDPSNWRASIAPLIALGYQQKVSFKEGIKRYIKWLKEKE